jgi:hypothetical protein
MKRIIPVLMALPLLAGCDAIKDRIGLPDPAKLEAEGNAIGSACRHAGRGLEDCYKLNPRAPKASVYAGWKEMNEYMLKNKMESVPPQLSPDTHPAPKAESQAAAAPPSTEAKTSAVATEKPPAEPKKEAAGH